ncbi:hypothetical protein ACF09L_07230 [Streptomyces sp. NPDC014779]|uniref:hypothetical protein n=1 Tax=unclassified Streptomyces TaxID=2593676 RepID=UPI0036FF0E21
MRCRTERALGAAVAVLVLLLGGAGPAGAAGTAPERRTPIAERDAGAERLWLLGGLGVALAATGVVALAAVRAGRER